MCSSKADKISLVYHTNQTKKDEKSKTKEKLPSVVTRAHERYRLDISLPGDDLLLREFPRWLP